SAGFFFSISSTDWIILILTSSIVLGLEGINTAIEKICNEVTLERKPAIRDIKDIAAGAVLLASIGAVIIGVLVFWKYLK
ncbi:MAG: diacylglycerol kinase (ATP), partial [Crocinitomicaceae bacterium]